MALYNIMKIQPKAVAEHRDLVLNCLEDEDVNIRLRALDLLEAMVTKRNLSDIVRKLLDNLEKAETSAYKDSIGEKIIGVCSKNNYQYITDFEWYISVLMELSRTSGMHLGKVIANQFMDVIIRVKMIRPYGIRNMLSLLRDIKLLSDSVIEGGHCEVLYSAAWCVGEFSSEVQDTLAAIEALLQPAVASL